SLSITLDRFYTETKVTFDRSLTEDKLILNGEKVDDKETTKIQKYMDIVREVADTELYAVIESENFVPTSAGLASSAS
ncbi:diphosphomevalonate decarboxylase, partial [Staphylococcus haemolyticus]